MRRAPQYVRGFKEFLFQRGEICLEPHWSLAGRRYPFDPDYEGFWKRSRSLRIRNAEVKVMSVEDSLLVLCLVGAKGRWKQLQMITDVAACIQLAEGIPRSRWFPDTPFIFSSLLFQQRESLRDRLTYLWHTTTTADLFHLQRMPLPQAAHPLYRVLVPLHDLVFYPGWRLLRAALLGMGARAKSILTPTT